MFLRDAGETEIGAFGISRRETLLEVEDLVLLPQRTSPVTVQFEDGAVADFFDEQVSRGRHPEEFGRIWIHTHPGYCPLPSGIDEETFARVFGPCQWAVMMILARGGATYARLAWHTGPAGALEIPVAVNYARPFTGSDYAAWQEEYDRCVMPLEGGLMDFDFWSALTPDMPLGPSRSSTFSSVPFRPGVPAHVD